MASTFGNQPFVQNSYTDNWTRGYPGQIVSAQTYLAAGLETYAAEEDIIMGRGVVQGEPQFQEASSSFPFVATAPFAVKNPTASTVAADLVGVAVRPYVTTTNLLDENDIQVAGYPAKDFAAILPFGSGQQIFVEMAVGLTVTVGQAVYIAIALPNDPTINIGEFTNDDAGTTGLLLVPNAVWWINKTATTNDTIGVIKI